MQALRSRFAFNKDLEIAIEVDLRTVNEARLENLSQLGFNRISFGVQDFDPRVQRAIHRIQDEGMVSRLVSRARDLKPINLDLIYDLPQQTLNRFGETLKKVKALRPDREALSNSPEPCPTPRAPKFDTSPSFLTVFEGWGRYESRTCI